MKMRRDEAIETSGQRGADCVNPGPMKMRRDEAIETRNNQQGINTLTRPMKMRRDEAIETNFTPSAPDGRSAPYEDAP